MSARCWIAGALGIAALGILGAQAAKQDKPAKAPPKAPAKVETAPAPDDEMMKALMPGQGHERLNPLVGTWDATVKFWPAGPESEPMEGTGTQVSKWVLGGRWIQTEYTATWVGEPFQGIGYTGYDNAEQRYVNTWIDSMVTGMMHATGTVDATGKVFTYNSPQHTCAMTGKPVSNRQVHTIAGNDKQTIVMYQTFAGEPEQKAGEIVYTRRK